MSPQLSLVQWFGGKGSQLKDQRGSDKVVALALEDYAQTRKLP